MAARLTVYLVSGALVAMWIAPPEGLYRSALIIALIIVAAYVDAWSQGRGISKPDRTNVVSLLAHRKRHRPGSGALAARERRSMDTVYSSHRQDEANELANLLREEGLRPVLVTDQSPGRPHRVRYEIRLAHHEAERAQALVKWFRIKAGKHPS